MVNGIPCTTVARTLLDLAAVARVRELQNSITQAEIHRVFDLNAVSEVIERSRGRRGVGRLRLAIDEHDPRSERANEGLERAFLTLCARANLPPPEVNVPIDLPDRQVIADFLWRDRRFIVETDDRASHQTNTAFEGDRRRDRHLKLAGWEVFRYTWHQVVHESDGVVYELRGFLVPAAAGN